MRKEQRFTRNEVIRSLRLAMHSAGSRQKLAAKIGVTRQYVSGVLNGSFDPGPIILRFMGLRKPDYYVPDEGEK